MIHQFILAAPRPGMSDKEFQDYWVNAHAARLASRIPQIRRYVVDTRIPFDGDTGEPRLPHQGIAEIWLANAAEHVASLQCEEYLHGARPDEPNWAALWLTIGIDTTAFQIMAGPRVHGQNPTWVKVTTLLKRRPGMPLAGYRRQSLASYADAVNRLPGLRRHLHCHTTDETYVFGESRFDSVEQLWFDDVDALGDALGSAYFTESVRPVRDAIADPRYVFSLTARENWIIGP